MKVIHATLTNRGTPLIELDMKLLVTHAEAESFMRWFYSQQDREPFSWQLGKLKQLDSPHSK